MWGRMMSKLCYLLAHEALTRFRARTLSPVELMEAVIRRAEAVKDSVNVLTHTHFDEALDLARKAEGKYARGARARPLKGLPIGIKDESRIAGTHFVGIADPEGCRGQNDLDQQRANSWCRRHRPCLVLGWFEVDPDLHKNTEATLQVVRSLGASVTEVETRLEPESSRGLHGLSGRGSNGVPTGIRIVGRSYSGHDVFQAGMAYEAEIGGWFGSPESRPHL